MDSTNHSASSSNPHPVAGATPTAAGVGAFVPRTHGNVFTAGADMVVNTTNRRGAMGRGIALAFKLAAPEYFRIYQADCRNQRYPQAGSCKVYDQHFMLRPQGMPEAKVLIADLIVKDDWQMQSCLAWTKASIKDLTAKVLAIPAYKRPKSIATPIPGAMNGGIGRSNPNGSPPTVQQAIDALKEEALILEKEGIRLILCHPDFTSNL